MNREENKLSDRLRSLPVDAVERWASLIGGGALAGWGVKRLVEEPSATNVGMTAAGGLLMYNGVRSYDSSGRRGVHLEATFTINKPPEELYRYWRNVENLPKFMQHLESVQASGNRLHWVARGPLGAKLSWDTEVTDVKENEWIVWRSVEDSTLSHSGSVTFRRAPGNRGTVVTVALQYRAASGPAGRKLVELLGAVPERQLKEELRRFKQLAEAGEIPTTEGQPSGRRSAVVSLLQLREPRIRMFGGARTA